MLLAKSPPMRYYSDGEIATYGERSLIARRISFVLVCLMLISSLLVACDNGGATATPVPATVTAGRSVSASPGRIALDPGPQYPSTPLPTATSIPRPSPTSTLYPAATNTPVPPTNPPTPAPTNTSTPEPGTPLSSPTATQVADVLARLVLQTYEVPANLTLDPTSSGELSNETIANGDATRLAQLKAWARQAGYVNVYRAYSAAPSGTVALLSSAAASYASNAGASAAWADALKRLQGSNLPLTAVAAAPHYTAHSIVLAYTDPNTNDSTAVLLVASGHLVAEVTIVGAKISPAALYPLAQIIVPRLVAAP